jgi:hypothetical protein
VWEWQSEESLDLLHAIDSIVLELIGFPQDIENFSWQPEFLLFYDQFDCESWCAPSPT